MNVFAFDPQDPNYTEPRNPLPNARYPEQGQVQTLAYANLRLTAFDRLHLETGLRWSRYENRYAEEKLCTSIPASGTPDPTNCVGRRLGDAYDPRSIFYSGSQISWPPSVALSYDATRNLTGYLSYTDIYEDQSTRLDGDLNSLHPVTGENVELGVKWAPRDGRLNAGISIYRIKKQGFSIFEPNILDRIKRNPDGSFFVDADGSLYLIANDGTELRNGRTDPLHECCFIQQDNRTQVSEGIDFELIGEVLAGWQVSASYTYGQTRFKGTAYGTNDGQPFLSIQPKHLYKLWTTYDFGAAGASGWLSRLSVSGGVNGQSDAYQSGTVCPDGQVGQPNPLTGLAPCLVDPVPYEFTVEPYVVVSGSIDYRIGENWFASLYIENVFDKTYYQSIGNVSGGNWYGNPRRFTLSLRAKW